MKIYILIIFVLTFAIVSHAQNYIPDPSFGISGVVQFDMGDSVNDKPWEMITQPDGKIILAGATAGPQFSNFISLVRLNPNGELDSSFGTNGKILIKWGFADAAFGVALDKEGRIILGGGDQRTDDQSTGRPAVYRFLSNGMIDSSFGINGRVITFFPDSSIGEYSKIFIDNAGRIFAAGTSLAFNGKGINGFLTAVFDSTGKPDSSYGNNSLSRISARTFGHVSAQFNNDGKAFMAASVFELPSRLFLGYTSIDPDGTVDTLFGSNGYILMPIESQNYDVNIARSINSHWIFSLTTKDTASLQNQFSLVRWDDKNFQLDSNWGLNGIANCSFSSNDTVLGALEMTGKKTIAVGKTSSGFGKGIVTRFDASGKLDLSFCDKGMLVNDLNKSGLFYFSQALATDDSVGSFYVMGVTLNPTTNRDFLIVRYIPEKSRIRTSHTLTSFSIFPNPSTNEIVIVLPAKSNSISISISDALGREIASFVPHEETIHYDVSNLPNGVYYCTVQSAAGRQTRKFVVSH